MRSNILFIRIFSVLTTAILLVGISFGQGKGHGGGKDKGERGNRGGSQGQEKHRGGNPDGNKGERRGGGNPWGGQEKVKKEKVERGGWQDQQKHAQKAERQQSQQWQQVQRQQNQHQRDAVRQDRQRDAVRQQDRQQRDVMRQQMQQQRQWQNAQREQRRVYEQPKQNWGQIRREQAFEAKRERDSLKSQRRSVRDAEKYAKKQQHFDDKAFRKAGRQYRQAAPYAYEQRDQWLNNNLYQPRYRDYRTSEPTYRDYRTYEPTYRDYRSYEPAYRPYNEPGYRVYDYSPNYGYNGDDGYYSSGRSSWVEPLIRSVIATFFSNGIGGGYYDDYADSQAYDRDGYGYTQYAYSQPSYNTFGYPPTYAYYEPAAYYGYDEYANNGIPYDTFQGVLPYNDVRDIYSGGLAGELIQRALGTGYYQGLLEGQQAQQRGWGDRYYSDPYLYEQAIYDPYSTSIGDNRRYFSEGYEMGYNDALRQRDEFDLADGGEVDLVSLLLGSVLSLRG